MKKISVIYFALILILCGCAGDCDDNYISENARPFLFKEGTYWVYIDSTTIVADTIIVAQTSHYLNTMSNRNRPTRCKRPVGSESHQMVILIDNDTIVVTTQSLLHLSSSSLNLYGYLFDPELSFNQCSKHDEKLCLSDSMALSIGSNNFTGVLPVNTQFYTNISGQTISAKLHLVYNIGAVKIEIGSPINKTLNLQSWHIVQ